MFILGIETTCDETAAAVVEDGQHILSNVIHSQIDLHQKFGGVFPEHASRRHAEGIIPVIDEAIQKANVKEIHAIAVAYGPGLIGPLLIGLHSAKALSLAWNIPYIGVNHVEAHLYAALMGKPFIPGSLGIVLSGGHTFLVRMHSLGEYEMIGSTVDDAIGEAFDKVATLLGLPYPGGPLLEKLAQTGDPHRYPFSCGKVKRSPFDFSFSGLKTSLLYAIKGKKDSPHTISDSDKPHLAASFQHTAFTDILNKTMKAAQQYNAPALYFGGGVCQNQYLRSLFQKTNLPIFWPPADLCSDNAAMIAGLGYHKIKAKPEGDALDLLAQTRIVLK